jgi:hypothetical protein
VSPSPAIPRLRLIGILFWLIGGGVIVFGWMGTAEVACVDCQIPYLLSGGAAGIGLIIVGSTLVIAAVVFQAAERTAQLTAQLLSEAAEAAVADTESESEAPSESVSERESEVQSESPASTDGDATAVDLGAPADAQSPK